MESNARRLPHPEAPSTALMPSITTYTTRGQPPAIAWDAGSVPANPVVISLIGQPGLSHAQYDAIRYSSTANKYGYTLAFTDSEGNQTLTWNLYNSNSYGATFSRDAGEYSYSTETVDAPITSAISLSDPASGFVNGTFIRSACIDWHGQYAPLGMDDERVYFFLNKFDVLLVQAPVRYSSGLTATVTATVEVSVLEYSYGRADTTVLEMGVTTSLPTTLEAVTDAAAVPLMWTCSRAGWYTMVVSKVTLTGAAGDLPATGAVSVTVQTIGLEARIFGNMLAPTNPTNAVAIATWNGTTWNPWSGSNTLATSQFNGWRLRHTSIFRSSTDGDPVIGQNVRCVSQSLLVTNRTPGMGAGGLIVASRLKNRGFWQVTYNDLLNSSSVQPDMPAEKGLYTFMVPEDGRLTFRRVVQSISTAGSLSVHLPTLFSDYQHFVVIHATISPFSTATADNPDMVSYFGNAWSVTTRAHFEFETSSRRYRTLPSSDTIEDLHRVIIHFNRDPRWFYENPSHAATIYAMLRGLMGKAVRLGKAAMPYAEAALVAYNPQLAPLISAVRGLVNP